ncbi:hypothetical protein DQ04_03891010 [Trypanosoma grayi]|uniref:hypothetical protein n=1 Tax=Trypanosoma grayi TaxID=71804 RepID=UPI0004F4991C|nr:hypothetical protein DQ04_03891010 [Trypanosoma grayi]KEG10312.1 hypothetical protein DQ04_03891010 [Trypanosoma grayi]
MEGAERALKKYFDGKVDPEFEEFFQNDDDLSVADYALRSYLTLLKWEKRVYTDDAWTDEKKRERCLFGFLSYFRNLVILDSLDVLDCRLKYVLRLHMQLSKIEPSFVKRKKFYILLVLFLRARIDPPSGDPDRSESDADDESETATQKRLGRALVGLVATLRALKEAKAEEERTEQGRAEIIKENADLDKQLETFSEKCESIRERVTALQAEKDRQEELIDELSADVELERILQITLSSETEENQAHFVR